MGRRGGCVLNGCLTVLVLMLVLVCGVWVWLETAPDRNEDQARDNMENSVAESKDRLTRAAADGTLLGTEIDRSVRSMNKSAAYVRREGQRVTVTAELMGQGPGMFVGGTYVTGCYRFEVVARSVTADEVSEDSCRDLPAYRFRKPAEVAADVVVELRSALARGGLAAVQGAEVWGTAGVEVEDQETEGGRLTALVWLSEEDGGDEVCYEFRAQEKPRTVTAKKLQPDGCYRIQREQDARAEAARTAELDASAEAIERRLDRAVADGTLTDAEVKRALALPRTDSMGQPDADNPVALPFGTERSRTEVTLVAEVRPLDQAWSEGCYEFRADLTKQSVTRRATGRGCLNQLQ
ncbi:hypothetical protein OG742_06535 [Streptomyces sp. NBC_00828]|uniref:hypothetical protein n=1 Tax=Streptomyces sp. NBC_00828 TaxID=2903678 RepID=UPI00386BF360